MAGHHDQVELLIPIDRDKVTEDPLDVRARARLVKHGLSGVEPAKLPGMPGLSSPMQQRTRPAADIAHRFR